MQSSAKQIAIEAMEGEVQGRRWRGRPKLIWKYRIAADMVERDFSVQECEDRSCRKGLIQISDLE